MKKSFKNCICVIPIFALLASVFTVHAVNVAPGESFTVSLACGVAEGSVQVSGNNASIVSAGNWCNRGDSISVSAVAGSAGSATIALLADDAVNTGTEPPTQMTGTISSVAVSIADNTPTTPPNNTDNAGNTSNGNTTQPEETPTEKDEPEKQDEQKEEQSGDSSLSSLQVSKGSLSPSFASDVYEYTLQLDDSVEMIQVDAQANHQKASVEGLGEKTLEHGENKLEILCTAENGSTSTYTIVVNVTDKPSVYVNYGSAKLGVLSQADTAVLSNAFTQITLTIDGQEITAWKNEAIPLTLVYLVNDKQEKDFYIYEEGKGVTSIYRPIALCGKNLVMIDIPQEIRERSHMNFGDIEVDGVTMLGWTFDDKAFSSYALIYMMDEQGNKKYYQYEKASNTLQEFSGAASITQEKYDAYVNKQQRNTMILGIATGVLAIVSLLLLYTTILFYRKKGKGKTFHKTDVSVRSLGRGSTLEADVLKKEMNENKEDL